MSGQAVKEMVTYIIFQKLIDLFYSHYNTVPLDSSKFIIIILYTALT